MCSLVELIAQSAGGCQPAIGGVDKMYTCRWADIASLTVTAGVVTGITMTSTGLWKKWSPTKDSTAYFKSTGGRATKNAYVSEQEGYLKYQSTTKEAIKAANSVIPCCDGVMIWFLENGSTLLQGVEYNSAGTGIVQSKEAATFNPSMDSGVGDDPSKVDFLIQSKCKSLVVVANEATITPTYIEAL